MTRDKTLGISAKNPEKKEPPRKLPPEKGPKGKSPPLKAPTSPEIRKKGEIKVE